MLLCTGARWPVAWHCSLLGAEVLVFAQALQLRRARQRGLQVGGLGFGVAPTRSDQMAALLRTDETRPGSIIH